MSEAAIFHATTIIAVRRNEQLVFCGDGQVSLGQTIMKGHAVKVRSLLDGQILTGFAGATADAFTLFEKFEAKLKAYNQNLIRAAVELAKDWRRRSGSIGEGDGTDRVLSQAGVDRLR